MSGEQVTRLLRSIRLRRYRIPVKLIYCAGLRLSECLSLTVDDILGEERKLMVRGGKGNKDRMVPLGLEMVEDLRAYWKFHRHPVLVFPNAGRGPCSPDTFRWKNRAKGDRIETSTLPGVEFVRRYLRHVLPRKMHSVRYYGFLHPAAKAKRERIAFQTGMPLSLGTPAASEAEEPAGPPSCPGCRKPMTLVRVLKAYRSFMPWPRRAPSNKSPPRCSRALLS